MANFNNNSAPMIWNMDEKRLFELNIYMISFMRHLNSNDLDFAYEDLESIDLILSGSIHPSVSKEIKDTWISSEGTKRKIFEEEDSDKHEKLKIKFRENMKTLFRLYNKSNIINNMYFRKGDDPNFAALKR